MRIARLLLVAAAACGHSSTTPPPAAEQSFRDGVQALCDVPDHVPDAAKPEDRLSGAGKWADAHVTNADARKLGDLGSLALDKEQLADAAKRANLTRCKLLDNGMSLQSYTDAMKAVCAAPSGDRDKSAAYLRSHLLNAEVIRMVESLAELDPADASKKMHDAIARAAITDCPLLGKVAADDASRMPHVSATDLPAAEASAPMLVATPQGIIVTGKMLVALEQGAVPPADLDGGATGVTIRVVEKFLDAYRAELAHHGALPVLQLAIAPSLPYRILVEVSATAAKAGFVRQALLVDAGGPRAIAIALANGRKPDVHVTAATRPAELTAPAHSASAPAIVIGASADTTVQKIADVLAVLHASSPTIELSSSFE